MEKGKRLAVLVGCNYPETQHELYGCHNDVKATRDMLVKRFGFDSTNIVVLTDKVGSRVMPTGANIRKALDKMVDKGKPGDVLFFHFSGHGTLIKSPNPSRRKEAIVPCDFNLITSVDFRLWVNRLLKGASFTIISDSCHSGGLIDKEKEQIGPSKNPTSKPVIRQGQKPKFIPYESILEILSSLANINTTDIGTLLVHLFGADASPLFQLGPLQIPQPGQMFQLLQPDQMFQLPQPGTMFQLPQPGIDKSIKPLKPDDGILLSGCQSDETAADVPAEENEGKAFGAFSNALQMVLKKNSGPLSNKEAVMMVRKTLSQQHFKQHPCLYSSDSNVDAIFLCQAKN